MESAVKRPKMSEPTQTSSETEEVPECVNSKITFKDYHNRPEYVDKTMFIKKLLSDGNILITAPSRFGKTLNMDMVRTFIEIEVDDSGKQIELKRNKTTEFLEDKQENSKNFECFEGKKIFNDKQFMSQHFGQYPTISVDFRDVRGDTFEEVLVKLRQAVNNAFLEHSYLEESKLWDRPGFEKETFLKYVSTEKSRLLTQDEVEIGLQFLSRCLYHHHRGKRVYVLMDECDVPVNRMIYKNKMKLEDIERTIECFQSINSNLLKGSKFVTGSLSTGCLQLAGIFSWNANNVKHYPFMLEHKYCEYYGLLDNEVHEMLERVGKTEDFERISYYYNGYKTIVVGTNREISIFSPWAVSEYLTSLKPGAYLSAGISKKLQGAVDHVQIRPRIAGIKDGIDNEISYVAKLEIDDIEIIREMLNDNKIEAEHEDLFLQFLYEHGFFYPISSTPTRLQLGIPNQCVLDKIDEIVTKASLRKNFVNENKGLVKEFNETVENLTKPCEKKDFSDVAKSIKNLIMKMNPPPVCELDIQCELRAALKMKFKMVAPGRKSHLRTFCDIILAHGPSGVGFIIEIKFGKKDSKHSCDAAHAQIFTKRYDTMLDDDWLKTIYSNFTGTIKKKIYLGIHVDNMFKVSIKYSIDGEENADYVFA